MRTLTQEELKRYLHYNPETGIFTWKVSLSFRIKVNDIAGTNCNGYIQIKIHGNFYKAHRLAFLYMIGSIPEFVDHIDMNKSNNKWGNLREANKSKNEANTTKRKQNTSGYKGVHLRKDNKTNPWRATIMFNNKTINLGYFKTAEEAAIAYEKKSLELFGEFASLQLIKKS